MITVLLVCTNADEAGAPRHVESIVSSLRDRYRFLCVFGERGPVADRISNSGVEVRYVERLRTPISPVNDLMAFFGVLRIVVRERPALMHCHSAKAALVGRIVARLTGVRALYTVHGWGWRGMPGPKGRLIKLTERLAKWLSPARYIYVADVVRAEGESQLGIESDRGTTIHNGIADKACAPRRERSARPLTIIMPARVCEAKDHDTLLRAFSLIGADWRLVLCGSGTSDLEFVQRAEACVNDATSRISFLGQVSDVEDRYEVSDVFVLSSNFEALPLSVIEAMSFGLPVVVTDVGGNRELIEDGVSGFLVPHGCPESLAAVLERLRDPSLRDRVGRNARERYLSRFSLPAMAASIQHEYEELVDDEA